VSLPSVSIVVVNLNGRHHFEQLFQSLRAVDYPSELLEIVVVDNSSVDGSVQWLDKHAPDARTVQCRQNHGFAGGVNVGVESSSGEVLVFLNTDMRVERNWLRELLAPIVGRDADCTSSLTLSWNGQVVNFGGSAMNFHGIGWQVGMNDPDIDRYRKPCDSLFACGGSMAIRRDVYEDAGRFDEEFFAYYEDVDLGWRLWSRGGRVLFSPDAVVRHRAGATSAGLGIYNRGFLFERNAFLTAYKNYEAGLWERIMPAVQLTLQARTQALLVENNPGGKLLRRDPFSREGERVARRAMEASERTEASVGKRPGRTRRSVLDAFRALQGCARGLRAKIAAASPYAILADERTVAQLRAVSFLLEHLDRAAEKRSAVQAARRRTDRDYFARFPAYLVPTYPGDAKLFASRGFRSWLPPELPLIEKRLDEVIAV
jgi:GT2 family glycosyltransferase